MNGSQHVLLSGHKPTNLKKGKAALVGLNEAQQIRAESYRNARGATVDAGGFSIVAANPPIAGDIGTWVLDAATAIEMNDRPAAEHVFIDPLLNPHADPRKLLALKSSMTLHDWETQIRGKMLQLPDRVLYTWDRAVNERPAPDFGRITREPITSSMFLVWISSTVLSVSSLISMSAVMPMRSSTPSRNSLAFSARFSRSGIASVTAASMSSSATTEANCIRGSDSCATSAWSSAYGKISTSLPGLGSHRASM